MTKKDYEKVVQIIEERMVVLHDNPNQPRLVLTQLGFSLVKKEIKKLIKEK